MADPAGGILVISAFVSNAGFLAAAALHAMRSHERALAASVLSVAAMVFCRLAAPATHGDIVALGELFGPGYAVWLAAGLLMLRVTLRGYLKRPTAASTTSPAG